MTAFLLSCPFCGGAAQLLGTHSRRFRVECTDCAAQSGIISPGRNTADQAVLSWNRRNLKPSKTMLADSRLTAFQSYVFVNLGMKFVNASDLAKRMGARPNSVGVALRVISDLGLAQETPTRGRPEFRRAPEVQP